MSEPTPQTDLLPNGAGAAAIFAAGFGSLTLGVFTLAGDALPAAKRAFNVWKPAGPLSGVTLAAILVWLVCWAILAWLWSGKEVKLGRVNFAAFIMLAGGLLLTFPPFIDWLQAK